MTDERSWSAMWAALGARHADPLLHPVLRAAYSEPHRRYHTMRHLEECLQALAGVRDEAERPAEAELALWFHDAIYEIGRDDNEQRSAEWARAAALAAGVERAACERVHRLVCATRHVAFAASPDEAVVVDSDLAILGAEPVRFDEYERQIRDEYASVPDAIYRARRAALLRSLLGRPRLFATRHCFATRERPARANLQRSLRALGD